jgi:hypothetical protein
MTDGRRRLVLTCCCLWVWAWATDLRLAGQQSAEFRLAAGRAGGVEIGLPVDDLYRLVGRENTRLVDLFNEGMFQPALEIRLPGSPVTPAIIVPVREWPCIEWSVQGIEVRDPRFRTAAGIGVGSTLADIRRHYKVAVSEEEGAHAVAKEEGMTFNFADGSFAPTAKVISVWIYGDPVAVRKARCPERGRLGR